MKLSLVLALTFALSGVARAGDGDFDFDLGQKKPAALDLEQQKKAEAIATKVKLRRRLLTAHQVMGIITLVLLAGSAVLGTLDYVDKFDKTGDYSGVYTLPHLGLASVTSGTFLVTGVLALAAPNPYPKKLKFDGALVHKLSMILATACFAAELVLGPISVSQAGKLAERDIAGAHMGIGWAALGFMTAGTLAFVFK